MSPTPAPVADIPTSPLDRGGDSTSIREGDMVIKKGDRDGHKFRVMKIVDECVQICCVEFENIQFLKKVPE